jgi:RES domain-containing protein
LSLSADIRLQHWKGVVFRGHHPKWAFDPLSGDGAKRYGGRLNAAGTRAFYTSLTPEGAWAETQQAFAFKAQPLTLCAYRVNCTDVLDLTTPKACAQAQINAADLACAWEDFATRKLPVPTWLIQDRLMALGVAAIMVPSFAASAPTGAINLVFWQWSHDIPHQVVLVDDYGRLSGR